MCAFHNVLSMFLLFVSAHCIDCLSEERCLLLSLFLFQLRAPVDDLVLLMSDYACCLLKAYLKLQCLRVLRYRFSGHSVALCGMYCVRV